MRRIKLVLAAVAALVAMLAVVPGPAMAQDLLNCEFVGHDNFDNDELYLCEVDVEEDSDEEEEEDSLFDEDDEEEDGLDDE